MFFRVAGKDLHMPKLIGSFILFAAFLMFVGAASNMFESWDSLKHWEDCLLEADQYSDEAMYNDCRMDLYYNTGLYMHSGEGKLTARQFWTALLPPIAILFFWLAILFLGYLLYKTGELVLPIEERIVTLKERKPRKRKRR